MDLEERRKLLACCDAVETGSVSRQMTSLRRSLVMENLEKRIIAEIEALALTHIPFTVNDRSQDGQSYFEVGLNAAKAIANSKVLSEGEQRALALACFLAEVGGDTSRQGMIIDDPVSSLDHVRIRRVAARLVKEAATGRQIIIFTHIRPPTRDLQRRPGAPVAPASPRPLTPSGLSIAVIGRTAV